MAARKPKSNTNPYPVDSTTRTCCGGIGDHTAECPPALRIFDTGSDLAPVDLDPPDPAIARWQALADVDLVINHDDDAEQVIPFPRPAWAKPDEDYVGKSICSTWYNSDTVSIPTSHMGGESRGGAILPSGVRVRGRLCGDGWHGVGMTIFRFIDDEWTDTGCTMTLDEARKLAEVLLAAADMIGAER